MKVPLPVVAQTAPEQQEENNADNHVTTVACRVRSRRSPRHLRVSGQRRRRYRDERYPNPVANAVGRSVRVSGTGLWQKSGSAIQLYVRQDVAS